jgi:hypothetical protein
VRGRVRKDDRPGLAYAEARAGINDGDVLLYRGRSIPSKIIRWATRSSYSHAGIAVWWNDRLMVLEAVGRGVMVTPLSWNVQAYHGDVELFSCIRKLTSRERDTLIGFAQAELGKEYDRWSAIVLGLKILFQRDREKRDALRRERKLFCSFYVAQAYNAAGVDLKEGVSDRFMSPGDVAASPMLRKVGPLRVRSQKG